MKKLLFLLVVSCLITCSCDQRCKEPAHKFYKAGVAFRDSNDCISDFYELPMPVQIAYEGNDEYSVTFSYQLKMICAKGRFKSKNGELYSYINGKIGDSNQYIGSYIRLDDLILGSQALKSYPIEDRLMLIETDEKDKWRTFHIVLLEESDGKEVAVMNSLLFTE